MDNEKGEAILQAAQYLSNLDLDEIITALATCMLVRNLDERYARKNPNCYLVILSKYCASRADYEGVGLEEIKEKMSYALDRLAELASAMNALNKVYADEREKEGSSGMSSLESLLSEVNISLDK